MTAKRKFQIVIDMMMTVILPLLMAYQLIGEAVHEGLGICMFLLFLCHHLLNQHWHRNLLKGRYNSIRLIGTIIDILLFIIMVSLAVSGVMMSKHVFTFLHIDGSTGSARIIHLLASYWGFVLMSVHVGLHWNMMLGMIKRTARREKSSTGCRIVLRVVAAILCCYGVHAFVQRQLGTYMLLKSEFVFFDFGESFLYFVFDYVAIMFLFACLGYYFSKLMKVNKKKAN